LILLSLTNPSCGPSLKILSTKLKLRAGFTVTT